MKWLSLLFLVLLSCQNPYVAPPPNTGGVVIAVGANGSIARSLNNGQTWETSMSNPNLPPSKVILGNKTFAGLVTFQQQPVMPSNQQGVNAAAAAGQINSVNGASEFFSDLYVKGTLYQQLGQEWTGPIANGFGASNINSVVYGNGYFIAVSDAGQIGVSSDYGQTWAMIVGASNPFGGGDNLECVAYGNGVFIAGASTGKIALSSNNGTSWTLVANPFTAGPNKVTSIAYGGGGNFVAVGFGGIIAFSSNSGTSWTSEANPFGGSAIYSVAYGTGIFVAVGSGKIARSTDGQSWGSLITNPFSPSPIFGVAFGNGVFVAVGQAGAVFGTIARSVDLGVSWGSLITNPFSAQPIYSVAYNFGVFQVGGGVGESARSYDSGETWGSLITTPFGANIIYGIASSQYDTAATNAFVAVGAAGNIATAGWNAVPLGTGAFYAPMPQTAAGVGQWLFGESGIGAALVLPAGGTWAWIVYALANGATNILYQPGVSGAGPFSGVSAGGTMIEALSAGNIWMCIAWRIA